MEFFASLLFPAEAGRGKTESCSKTVREELADSESIPARAFVSCDAAWDKHSTPQTDAFSQEKNIA